MDKRPGFHFQQRDVYFIFAHITSRRYEAIYNLCSFWNFFNWISTLEDIISLQFKTDPYVITWCMTGIHLSKKCDASFLPKIIDMRITMIWILFKNYEFLHLEGVGFDIKFPSDHHPFITVKKSRDSILLCNHFGVTLTWYSLKWYN